MRCAPARLQSSRGKAISLHTALHGPFDDSRQHCKLAGCGHCKGMWVSEALMLCCSPAGAEPLTAAQTAPRADAFVAMAAGAAGYVDARAKGH